jgi:two-component system, LuxR family, sensor kinase FixL
MFRVAADGACQYANARCEAITGLRGDESLGHRWLQAIHPDDRDALKGRWREATTEGRDITLRFRYQRGDGITRWALVRAAPILPLPKRRRPTYVGTIEDVTERRSRRERIELQARILAELSEGVTLMRDDGTITYANRAMEQMFGYSPGELVGLGVGVLNYDTIARKRELLNMMREEVARSGRWVGEYHSLRRDGSQFTTRAAVSAFEAEGQRLWITIRRDITERKRLEAAVLQLAQSEQREVARQLHEGVGQDLTSLSLAVRAFRLSTRDGSSETTAQFLADLEQRLSDAVGRTRRAAEGLSAFSLEREDFSLAMGRVIADFESHYGVRCLSEIAHDVNALDLQQRHQLYFILQEAMENAGLHSGASQVRLWVRREARGLVAEVIDDGRGIADPGQSGPNLGLAIMQHRASLIGATVQIDGNEPTGTRVSIVLGRPKGDTEAATRP